MPTRTLNILIVEDGRFLRTDPRTASIPVMVLTSLPMTNETKLVRDGATSYFEKSGLMLDKGSTGFVERLRRCFPRRKYLVHDHWIRIVSRFPRHVWDRGAGTCNHAAGCCGPQVGSPIFSIVRLGEQTQLHQRRNGDSLATGFMSTFWTIVAREVTPARELEWQSGCWC